MVCRFILEEDNPDSGGAPTTWYGHSGIWRGDGSQGPDKNMFTAGQINSQSPKEPLLHRDHGIEVSCAVAAAFWLEHSPNFIDSRSVSYSVRVLQRSTLGDSTFSGGEAQESEDGPPARPNPIFSRSGLRPVGLVSSLKLHHLWALDGSQHILSPEPNLFLLLKSFSRGMGNERSVIRPPSARLNPPYHIPYKDRDTSHDMVVMQQSFLGQKERPLPEPWLVHDLAPKYGYGRECQRA